MESTVREAFLLRLRKVISLWPKSEIMLATPSNALKDFLTSDFDNADLINRVAGVSGLLDLQLSPDKASMEFVDFEGVVHQAIFRSFESDVWKLQSLKFQCPVCFGEGVNNGDTCIVCGGSGWGAT